MAFVLCSILPLLTKCVVAFFDTDGVACKEFTSAGGVEALLLALRGADNEYTQENAAGAVANLAADRACCLLFATFNAFVFVLIA
jgi:hypothetical protein